jgi:hypothetical protein
VGISTYSTGPPLGGLDVQERSLCCTPPQKTQNIWHHMAPVLKLKVFNATMHTITGNQINLFLYKGISDMCTVTFKELSMYDISCTI